MVIVSHSGINAGILRASCLFDLLMPESGPEIAPDSGVASEDVIWVPTTIDVSRVLLFVDLAGARDIDPIFGINQELPAGKVSLQKPSTGPA